MQKSGKFIKIKRTILNVGFLSAIAIIPTNLMALSFDDKPGLSLCSDHTECAAINCRGLGGYCCPTGNTVTEYTCPSGCVWNTINSICECSSVSGLTDVTGTYTGSTCTTSYESSKEKSCYKYQTSTPTDSLRCFHCSAQ